MNDRIKAASICKRWRSCLFHPSLWNHVVFELSGRGKCKSKFLAERCGRFVRGAVVKFNSHNITEVRDCGKILEILSENKNLQYFSLQPSSCHIEWLDITKEPVHIIDKYLDWIESLIKSSRKLKHFSLGCVEDLLVYSNTIVNALSEQHGYSLESLHLASVKEDSENYGIIELTAQQFKEFSALKSLSIDYDYLTNELLESFVDTRKTKLEKICIHIHGIEADHEVITNNTWRKLKNYSPNLEVTLNFIHSYDGVVSLLDILKTSMPLVHFRQFFCSHINMAAIGFIAAHFFDKLRTFHIIDGLVDGAPNVYQVPTVEDPFVMMAWRCHKLENFSLIGYEVAEENVIAIARLRSQQLKTLNIPLSCMSTIEEEDSNVWISMGNVSPDFQRKVSESLRREWQPLDDSSLPSAFFSDEADAEAAYMTTLLADQAWQTS